MVQRWMDGVMGDDAIPMVEPSAGSEQLGKIAKVVGTVEKSGDKEVTTTSGKKCTAYATTVYEVCAQPLPRWSSPPQHIPDGCMSSPSP